jgi:hypothetical protein
MAGIVAEIARDMGDEENVDNKPISFVQDKSKRLILLATGSLASRAQIVP